MPERRMADLSLDHEALTRRRMDHRFGLVAEEVIDRVRDSGTRDEPVVVEQHDPTARHARVEEAKSVERRLMKIDIDVKETEVHRLHFLEAVGDPPSIEAV